MKKQINLSAALLLTALISHGGLIELNPDTLDTQVNTLGTISWTGGASARVGTDAGTSTSTGYVMPFLMTALPSGESISSVSLSIHILSTSNLDSPGSDPNVDLVGIGVRASATVLASDISGGTAIADDTFSPISSVTTGTSNISDPAMVSWISSNWSPGDYLFFTLKPDAGNTVNSRYFTLSTANDAINTPVLSITTAIPEPSTFLMMGIGISMLLGTSFHRKRK